MQNVGSNIGINLARSSNLPKMNEVVLDALDIDTLNEDNPMLAMDGKKRPCLHKEDNEPSSQEPNVSSVVQKMEAKNFQPAEPIEQVSRTL